MCVNGVSRCQFETRVPSWNEDRRLIEDFGTLRRERTLSTVLHNGPRNEQIKNPEHLSRVVQNASPPIAF